MADESDINDVATLDDEQGTGLEDEQTDADEAIEHPFNPEEIAIDTVHRVIQQIVSRIEHNEINLAPDFQRLRGIWTPQRKSRLIESLLLRIPLPVFYVAADANDDWAVVDGIQRMSAIHDYVTGRFSLQNLEYLSHLVGKRYDELPRPMQRRIDETNLIVNVIKPGTPEEVMFNIFSRINTGGMTLNGQEIRHALHKGPARDYLKELAESEEFLTATNKSVNTKRMGDRECVLRFLAFHIEPWEQYSGGDLDGYLGQTMDQINAMSDTERLAIANDFKTVMRAATAIFGDYAFRKQSARNLPRNPINKALFETWSVHLARCSEEEIETLIANRDHLRDEFIALMNNDPEFEKAISYSTSHQRYVHRRFSAIGQLIEECAR